MVPLNHFDELGCKRQVVCNRKLISLMLSNDSGVLITKEHHLLESGIKKEPSCVVIFFCQ